MYTYVASPYSHREPPIMRERFYAAMKFTSWLLEQGQYAYSPIVHCHEMAIVHDLPFTFDFWERYNCAMIAPAKSLTVLTLHGWEESVGVRAEIKFASLLGKPIRYAHVNDLFDYMITDI